MKHLGINALFLIPGQVGGSETYLCETLKELLPILTCRCTIFTNSDNDSMLRNLLSDISTNCNVEFCCLNFSAVNRTSRIIREQVQLPFAVKKAGCDLLWSPGYTSCLFLNTFQVVSILDMQYRHFRADLTPLAWLATHILVSLGVRKCKRILTLSNFAKDEICRFTKIDDEKIDVSPLGVTNFFADVKPFQSSSPYILSVAASYPHKNLPQLVRAYNLIADKIPHNLIIAGGKGLGEGELLMEIDKSPVKSRIIRKSWMPLAELRSLYAGASLFVLTSQYEGFGIPVIESQMAKVPVISTECASIPEVGGDAIVKYDYCSDNALSETILSTLNMSLEERRQLVDLGVKNAAKFTWRRCAEITLISFLKASQNGRQEV